VLSLAFNNRCDVIVATMVAGDEPVAQEWAVLEFLTMRCGSGPKRRSGQPPPPNNPEPAPDLKPERQLSSEPTWQRRAG
jgi:hypothetical protein